VITVPTILILGAGASADMGYPTGGKLRKQLLQAQPAAGPQVVSQSPNFTAEQITEFQRRFHDSQLETIDGFLELTPDLRPVGKFMIAQRLFSSENDERIMYLGEKCWYRKLRMLLGNSVEHLRQNQLKIVTFNYDRSLEHYLYRSFAAVASEEERRVLPDYIDNLGFVHIHGMLSRLNWQPGGGRAYGQVQKGEEILAASQSMLLTHQTGQIGYAGAPVAQLIECANYQIVDTN